MGAQGRRYGDAVREVARELRRSGRTYDDIALELGISKSTCSLWLRDVGRDAAPGQLALDVSAPGERRAAARRRREEGALLREVAEELGVSLRTAWSWCAGLPVPDRARHGGDLEHVRRMSRVRWDAVLAEREQARRQVWASARTGLGAVTPRDLVLGVAVSYWCEGTKAKPWRPQERVVWLNSDAGLVRLFLAGLRELGVPDEQRVFRLQIHERADESAAREWWADVVGVDACTFASSTLKRHNPRTVRRNVGEDYHGCLSISVRQSRWLYQYLDGVVRGLVQAVEDADRTGRVAR